MLPNFVVVFVSLLLYAGLCNGDCVEGYEDVFTVDCTFSYLREVPLEEIPNDVQSLDLSNNELTKLKRSQWTNYDVLDTLYLTDNDISEIEEDAFSDLKKLSNLDLSSNKLSHISPDLFSSNNLLEHVSFSNNPELYVPPNSPFLISRSLLVLDMSSCHLTSLYPETFSQLNLEFLDLSYNNLENIYLEMFASHTNLNTLDLRSNKWKCDSEIVELLNMVSLRRLELNMNIEHPPVKCLDGGNYKKLWSLSSLKNTCEFNPKIKLPTTEHTPYSKLKNLDIGVYNTLSTSVIPRKSTAGSMKTEEHTMETPTIGVQISKTGNHHQKKNEPSTESDFSIKDSSNTLIPLSSSGRTEESKTRMVEFQSLEVNTVLLLCILATMLVISISITIMAVNMFSSWKNFRLMGSRDTYGGSSYYSDISTMPSSICGDEKKYTNDTNSVVSNTYTAEHIYETVD